MCIKCTWDELIIKKSIFNYRYIFSLALADLLVIIICVPLASLVYTLESWPWGSALCRITECAKDISIGVSVFTLTALSAERYCAIVNPLRKLQVHRNYRLSQYYLLYDNIHASTHAANELKIEWQSTFTHKHTDSNDGMRFISFLRITNIPKLIR